MADPGELSQLSVKCNRILPKCGRCETHNVDCSYPRRVKRKATKQHEHGFARGPDQSLSLILERLQRVEDKCTALPPKHSPRHSSVINSIEPTAPPLHSVEPAIVSPPKTLTPSGLGDSESPWVIETAPPPVDFDAEPILASAIDEVQKQVSRQVAKSVINDTVSIPKHLSKVWIEAFFKYKKSDMFVGLIDRKLIELMPDLIDMTHVHVDAAVVLIYYTALYHGCGIAASTANSNDIYYSKALYVYCLRAHSNWQREATGTLTDLVMVCADSFDFEMGWHMYKYACDYVKTLDLRNLDADIPGQQDGNRDNDRKGFWELVQMDLIFQLLFDKPPSITATAWKVNMPWLKSGTQPIENGMAATLFVASSQIALILMRFFPLLEAGSGISGADLMTQTEALCGEVKQLYTDGLLGQLMLNSAETAADVWRAIDVTLTGHICIVFMLRKAAMHNRGRSATTSLAQDLSGSQMVLDAARSIMETSLWLLNKWPWQISVNALFGAFHIHVPYAILANAICHAPNIVPYKLDIDTLRRMSEATAKIADHEREYVPLVRALQTIDLEFTKRGA
ncbi:hypothetical protein HJFPF1_12045 [Paramyrothecium foliicola]|nr:hypothetical protein HJFPF1_12045 [Paramyrothecium foliicola]